MTHEQSLESQAPERYLLGEMSELERHRFEEHYFACEDCAESVRLGAILAGNARAAFAEEPVRREVPVRNRSWLDWLRVPVLAPSAVALALACMVGYQALIQMPALRSGLGAQAVEPVALRSASRGSEPSVPVASGPGFFSIAVFVTADPQGSQLSYTLTDVSGRQAASGMAPVPAPGRSLLLLFPNSSVRNGGRYTLRVQQPGRELGEFPFVVAGR
jgi:hypothetical protein